LLRVALGTVMLASGMALFGKAGLDVPAAVLVAVPVVLAVVSVAVLRRRAMEVSSSS
jgi:hypothetical protein